MLKEDLNALTARFIAEWTFGATYPVIYDGAPQGNHPKGSCQFSVILTASQHLYGNVVVGAKKQNGFVELNIDVPDQNGDKDAILMMESFANIFRNWTDNTVVCQTEYMTPKVNLKNGLIRYRISVPFFSIRQYAVPSINFNAANNSQYIGLI